MAIPESAFPATVIAEISKQLAMLVEAQRGAEVATLTAAVVAAMNRPVSINEVLEIRQDLFFSLYRGANSTQFQAWQKIKEQQLAKIRE